MPPQARADLLRAQPEELARLAEPAEDPGFQFLVVGVDAHPFALADGLDELDVLRAHPGQFIALPGVVVVRKREPGGGVGVPFGRKEKTLFAGCHKRGVSG